MKERWPQEDIEEAIIIGYQSDERAGISAKEWFEIFRDSVGTEVNRHEIELVLKSMHERGIMRMDGDEYWLSNVALRQDELRKQAVMAMVRKAIGP